MSDPSWKCTRSLALAAVMLAMPALLPACAIHKTSRAAVDASAAESQEKSTEPACCPAKKKPVVKEASISPPPQGLTIPDVTLVDQDGQEVRFFTDLVAGRTVAINTFFTSCTTICPPLTATIAQVQRQLKQAGRDDVQLISISVDPVTDTPPRIKAWTQGYHAQPGWRFVTGKKAAVDKLLKALRSFTPDPVDHSPMILIGNEPAGVWKQVYGLSSAADVYRAITEIAGPKPETPKASSIKAAATAEEQAKPVDERSESARKYFTDVELVDHHGQTQRLYSDLLKGRTFVISSFFASCTGVCPVMNRQLAAIHKAYEDRMGKDLFLLSISVDPLVDTPERLGEFAKSLGAGPGWYFLSGKQENVEQALYKLGLYVEQRENHSNLFLVGNESTGLWKKAFGLAPVEELLEIIGTVLDDEGTVPQ